MRAGKSRTRLACAAALVLFACSSGERPPAALEPEASATPARTAEVDCSQLTEAECQASAACEPLWGWRPEDACAGREGERIHAGCHPAGTVCGEAETCAASSETGELVVFPTTCLPEGWTRSDTCCPG